MIFGKDNAQRDRERRERLEAEVYGVRKFVVLKRLESGRWAAMQHVWAYRDAVRYMQPGNRRTVYFGDSEKGGSCGLRYYEEPSAHYVHIEVRY